MKRKKLAPKRGYRVSKKKVIFSKGPIHLVDYDIVLNEGRMISRQILEHPGSVVIIPCLARDQYVLVKQFRFATGRWIWEFPAGGVEPGESLKRAAARELTEEINYRPLRLTKLAEFYPTPGISGEKMYLFIAEILRPQKGCPDEDEELESQVFSLGQIEKMIQRKIITDAKTILGYFILEKRLRSK